jgi:hypothetical protein
MRILRFLNEGLLHAVYRLAWAAFWGQATAFAAALSFAVVSGQTSSPWVVVLVRAGLVLGGVFAAGGILLLIAFFKPRDPAAALPAEPAEAPAKPAVLLALSLLVLAGAAWVGARDLFSMWREIFVLLDREGILRAFTKSDPMGGIVLLPIAAVLYAPAVSGISALALIGLPVLLAVAAVTRSPRLRAIFTTALICWSVLVVAAIVSADTFARVLDVFLPQLRKDPDPVAAQVAAELARCAGVIRRAGWFQGAVLLCHLIWIPFARMSAPAAPTAADQLDALEAEGEIPGAEVAVIEPMPAPTAVPARQAPAPAPEQPIDLQEAIRRYRERHASPAPVANADPPHEAPAPGEAPATGPVDLQEEIRRYRERHKAG